MLLIVKPAREGLVIPMPNGADLPADGARVDAGELFWLRRIADGDVVMVDDPADPAEASAPKKRS